MHSKGVKRIVFHLFIYLRSNISPLRGFGSSIAHEEVGDLRYGTARFYREVRDVSQFYLSGILRDVQYSKSFGINGL
jgi:hypothetical protein